MDWEHPFGCDVTATATVEPPGPVPLRVRAVIGADGSLHLHCPSVEIAERLEAGRADIEAVLSEMGTECEGGKMPEIPGRNTPIASFGTAGEILASQDTGSRCH